MKGAHQQSCDSGVSFPQHFGDFCIDSAVGITTGGLLTMSVSVQVHWAYASSAIVNMSIELTGFSNMLE